MKKLKALFIFPPLWSCYSPSTGIPQIMGYLEKYDYNVTAIDVNIKFFYFLIKNKEYLNSIIDYYSEKIMNNKNLSEYYKKLLTDNNCKNLKFSLKILKTLEHFKNKKKLQIARKYIFLFISIVQSVFKDSNYLRYLQNCDKNVIVEFFDYIFKNINIEEFDFIGFSANSDVQYYFSQLFSKKIKQKRFNCIIGLGGTYLSRLLQQNEEYIKKILDNNYDVLINGAGEITIKEILDCISDNKEFSSVSNIIYKDRNRNVIRTEAKLHTADTKTFPCFNGYNFKEYTLPEPVFPIRVSFGCYYGKCVFCDYPLYGKYKPKNTEEVISEISGLKNRYGISNFYFVDAALPPSFLDAFSKKIIENGIEIFYYTNLRFEKYYTKEFLLRLYKSGLRCVGWGLESASQKVLKDMNKRYDIIDGEQILKNSFEIGIKNHLYLIIGFPTETQEDFNLTYDFLLKNKDYIYSTAIHPFQVVKGTYLYNNPEKFNLSNEQIDKIFNNNSIYQIEISELLSQEEKENFSIKMNIEENIIKKISNVFISLDSAIIESKYLN